MPGKAGSICYAQARQAVREVEVASVSSGAEATAALEGSGLGLERRLLRHVARRLQIYEPPPKSQSQGA